LKKLHGVLLVIFGILTWFLLGAWRWDYIVHVLYPGEALGEGIWAYDPGFFIINSFACGLITLIGLLMIFSTLESDYYAYRSKSRAL